jgi:hypothetical protein
MTPSRRLALLGLLGALATAGCESHTRPTLVGPPACPPPAGAPILGCANAANLAAMVADPADLRRGRALTPASGAREARVIEQYEAGDPGQSERPAPDHRLETTQ